MSPAQSTREAGLAHYLMKPPAENDLERDAGQETADVERRWRSNNPQHEARHKGPVAKL